LCQLSVPGGVGHRYCLCVTSDPRFWEGKENGIVPRGNTRIALTDRRHRAEGAVVYTTGVGSCGHRSSVVLLFLPTNFVSKCI
jgi:hypothetical protein